MGFKGAKPFCESLSTFFSEESRGPSRPERQMKRDLRGKSEAGKGKKNKREKPCTQSAWQANGKSGNQTRRPGNDAAECGQRKAAEGRHDCGKPHAQPPGGGTSLHPGAASQTGQTAAAKAPHTQAHGGQTASRPRQHRPDQAQKQQAARKPGTRQRHTGRKMPEHRAQKPPQRRLAAQRRPAQHMARHGGQKNPSEQAKLAFALLPARRGLVKRGRQKFASLFLAGTAFLLRVSDFTAHCACFAARSAAQKGAPPPFIPRKLFEKSLSKNFHEGPGAPRP